MKKRPQLWLLRRAEPYHTHYDAFTDHKRAVLAAHLFVGGPAPGLLEFKLHKVHVIQMGNKSARITRLRVIT